MKTTRALLFVFCGDEPVKGLIKDLSGMICAACNVEHIDSFEFEPNDIAAALVAKSPSSFETSTAIDITPEDKAVIYIGKLMKDDLGPTYKAENFVTSLMQKLAHARANPTEGSSRCLLNAAFILSQEDLKVSRSILKEYRMDSKKIEIVKRIYNLMSSVG